MTRATLTALAIVAVLAAGCEKPAAAPASNTPTDASAPVTAPESTAKKSEAGLVDLKDFDVPPSGSSASARKQ